MHDNSKNHIATKKMLNSYMMHEYIIAIIFITNN